MCLSHLQVFTSRREYPTGCQRNRARAVHNGEFLSLAAYQMRPGTGRSHPNSRIVRSAIVLSRSCHARRRTCAKASRLGKRSFVRQRQSSIKKDTTALHFPISCEPLVWKKEGFTGTLRAKKSLRETPSTTLGKLQWMHASKEQRRSRIPLIVSNKSCGTFATDVQDWCREAARC